MHHVHCLSLLLLAASAFAAPLAVAHEGHDHDDQPVTAAATTGTGTRTVTELTSELYEALVESHGDHLDIYLDRYDSNEPVTGAALTVAIGDSAAKGAEEETPGQYMVSIAPLTAGTSVPITLTVKAAAGEDLLGGTLESIVEVATPLESRLGGWIAASWRWALGLLALVAVGALARRVARQRHASPGAILAMGLLGALATHSAPTIAHEGEDHEDGQVSANATVGADRPMRLADGSVFVPKATQRIIELRTQIAIEGPTPVSLRLVGEIVGDPRASAVLQTLQGGRVAGNASLWPVLGAKVRRGQVLLRLTASGSGGERAATAAEGARVQAELAQASAELARVEGLPGVVSRAEIEAARSRQQSLRAQRAALGSALGAGEAIVCPIDGIIAAIEATPGAVAAPGESLITVIDPARLSVQALAFEAIGATAAAGAITRASVALRDGTRLEARVEGIGSQLKGGAIPVRLNLLTVAPGLAVGQPVVVYLERSITTPGLPLPVEALVRTPNGDRVIFEKVSAERFVPRTVLVRQVSAGRIAVLSGLQADARVVVRGAALVAQIR